MALDVDESIQDLRLRQGLLEKDVISINMFCEKLSESIQKIQELNVNFVKMISLFEQRHVRHDEIGETLKGDIKEIHSRIASVNKDMHDRMFQIEVTITQKLEILRNDMTNNYYKQSEARPLINSIKSYDTIKWIIFGAAGAIGWIIGHMNVEVLGTLFK